MVGVTGSSQKTLDLGRLLEGLKWSTDFEKRALLLNSWRKAYFLYLFICRAYVLTHKG